MLKNMNCIIIIIIIIIIITLEGIKKIKTEKNGNKGVWTTTRACERKTSKYLFHPAKCTTMPDKMMIRA